MPDGLAMLKGTRELEAVQEGNHSQLALELLATPISPVRRRLIVCICLLLFSALLLSYVAKIDILAVAPARIQPTGQSKVIQPLETSRVRSLYVENGTKVQQGDLLIELDPTIITADQQAYQSQLDALDAEIARRRTAIEAARESRGAHNVPVAFAATRYTAARDREEAVLVSDLAALQSSLEALEARIAENLAHSKALELTIAEQKRLSSTIQQRVDMRRAIAEEGLGSRASVIEAEEVLGTSLTQLAGFRGELLRAKVANGSIRTLQAELIARFVAENSQRLVQAQTRRDELAQSAIKASARVSDSRLRAPITGTVQELSVTTIGQVVSAGQRLLTIVPLAIHLEAEALVVNQDIGFIEVGQKATLKIDSFQFTRYGTVTGRVARISNEAVNGNDALPSAESRLAPSASRLSAMRQIQGLVYPVTIVLEQSQIETDGKQVQLLPGMSATVEIRTGRRRIIDYALAPILEVASEAAHER